MLASNAYESAVSVPGGGTTTIAARSNRVRLVVQNAGTTPLEVSFTDPGGGFILAAGEADDDGKGGALTLTDWIGAVVLSNATVESGRARVQEFALGAAGGGAGGDTDSEPGGGGEPPGGGGGGQPGSEPK